MEKTQGDDTAVILNSANQTAASTIDHIAGSYLTLNNHLCKRLNSANRGNFSAIYIAQGQMKKKILNAVQAELLKFTGQLWAHAAQLVDASILKGCSRH
jgi:hypothetical protein